MQYDAVLLVAPSKIPLLKISISYLYKNLGAKRIVIIASKESIIKVKEVLSSDVDIKYIDEDDLFQGLTYGKIRELLLSLAGDAFLTGWYLQQFLKMAYAYICEDDYYLVFDSDTVPLHPISYFDKDNIPQFVIKTEYNKPYFDTMQVLFDGKVGRVNQEESFIAENMIISKNIMIEIIGKIMDNPKLEGDTFFERILLAIDRSVVMKTGFSEFETYGNYVMTYYTDMYRKKTLRSQRYGSFLFGFSPTNEQLEWASRDYDLISFEIHGKRLLQGITKYRFIRNTFSAKFLYDFVSSISGFFGRQVYRYKKWTNRILNHGKKAC